MTGYLLDGRALQDRSSVRGIGTYMRGLLQGMRQLGVSDELTLLLSEGKEAAEGDGFHDANFRLPAVSRQLQPLLDPFL
ncbi:MAG TPA: hypothetical protein VE219_03855, partial [Candidatus Sulfotelmatobacter sp.]|nr:hypothetical protein [Candidatus Sulfotelmatobacter sp.]